MVAGQGEASLPPLENIKDLIEPLPPEFSLEAPMLKLFHWAREHYLAPPGEVLRTFFPNKILQGNLNKGDKSRAAAPNISFQQNEMVTLNPEQERVLVEVKSHLGSFFPMLLQGITGSGKTEIYLRLCETIVTQLGGAVLIMVPEIALTPQMVGRFFARFGEEVGTYHSGMTESQRLKTWWAAKQGRQKIFIGTRSAACLPIQNLSLIVVDEEHDSSYKQEERFRYNGRDLAVMRAKLEQFPILLGSATPSMESLNNVHNGKYHHLTLTRRATQGGTIPRVHLVDLRKDHPHFETMLSPPLVTEVHRVLERGEQALIFLNRRGFAPCQICTDCGELPRCPNCEIGLTFHRRPPVLKCHYCEFQSPHLEQCPKCQVGRLEAIGTGTQRLEEGFAKQFPGARIGRLDRDTGSRLKTEQILSQFETGQLDILIGTQLVTKGHDFKRLTLVGILLADHTLNLPDFRAAERLFQIVTQVSGRAGRHDLPGTVFLQTYRPEHFAIITALEQNIEQFYVREKIYRETLGYPPFSRLILLRVMGNHQNEVREGAGLLTQDLTILLKNFPGVKILGPAPATLEKIRGKFRWQVLLRLEQFEAVRRALGEKIPQLETRLGKGLQLQIDVDPVGVF
jgi:primosomal protein N' (replication factor Y)